MNLAKFRVYFWIAWFLFFTCVSHVHAKQPPRITTSGDQSPAISATGDVNIRYGISEERFQKLSEQLGVTKAALKSFFKILKRKHVPLEDLDSTLRQIAGRYKELQQKLADFQSDDPKVAKLKQNAAKALTDGDFDQAEKLINEAKARDIRIARKLSEIANKRLLSAAASAAANGDLKNTQLDYQGAAAYFSEAVDLVPKENETLLADYLKQQGDAFYDAGKYADAEAPLKRSMQIRERVLGKQHPDLSASQNNLALLYQAQGRYEAAEPLYKRSLAIKEKVLGPEHPELATTLNNLAGLYRAQGRYEEAEPLYKRSLAIKEKVLGPEHPELATTLNNLAGLYEAQGRYEEAEPLYKRSLAIALKSLGPDHPNVKIIRNNYGRLIALKAQNAVKIVKCINGGQSLKEGLQKDDIILTYDGVRVKNSQELIQAVKQKAEREQVAILIARDRRVLKFTMSGGPLGVQIENTSVPDEEIKQYLQQQP